jgi:hypothetical protein
MESPLLATTTSRVPPTRESQTGYLGVEISGLRGGVWEMIRNLTE